MNSYTPSLGFLNPSISSFPSHTISAWGILSLRATISSDRVLFSSTGYWIEGLNKGALLRQAQTAPAQALKMEIVFYLRSYSGRRRFSVEFLPLLSQEIKKGRIWR